jgi:23S rRNA (uracil1939-C5)-methyltransferase
MLKKNDTITLDITEQGKTGDGMGFVDTFPVYVPNCISGDRISCKILKIDKRRAYGKCMRVLSSSNDRVVPKCAVAATCGGCGVQHQALEAQVRFRETLLKARLARFLMLPPNVFRSMVRHSEPWEFRNKLQCTFGMDPKTESVTLGLYAARSHRVVDIDSCPIIYPKMNTVFAAVKDWAVQQHIPIFNELTGEGVLRFLTLRYAPHTEQVMLIITGSEPVLAEEWKHTLKDISGITSAHYCQQGDPTNDAVVDALPTLMFGEPVIEDVVFGVQCNISPLSFMQGNGQMVDVLYQTFLEALDYKGGDIVDLYCGAGVFTIALARGYVGTNGADKQGKVIGVDINASSIADAVENAKRAKVDVDFKCVAAEAFVQAHDLAHATVIMDPPRKGCDPTVLDALLKATPKTIAFMSCYPDSLGRDLRVLVDGGYRVTMVQPVDMFPHTAHVEAVVMLSRDAS